MNKEEIIELANGLQHSNIPELAKLAKAYLELTTDFEQYQDLYWCDGYHSHEIED